MKVSTFKLYTRGLASDVVQTVRAVVAYAEQHKETRVHCMELPDFCRVAGFSVDTKRERIVEVLSRAHNATASLRIVDASLPRKKILLSGSCPVFEYILIAHSQISFKVCSKVWTWENLS